MGHYVCPSLFPVVLIVGPHDAALNKLLGSTRGEQRHRKMKPKEFHFPVTGWSMWDPLEKSDGLSKSLSESVLMATESKAHRHFLTISHVFNIYSRLAIYWF